MSTYGVKLVADAAVTQPWSAENSRNAIPVEQQIGEAAFDQFVISAIPVVGPILAMFGKNLGLFGKGKTKETHHSRAAGGALLDPKAGPKKLNDLFLQALQEWRSYAEAQKDPVKKTAALDRLNQIEGAWKLGIKTLEGVEGDQEKYAYAFSQLFGQAGSLEKGKMGDVFALILSRDVTTFEQLMGQDGYLGMGDGLDFGEWKEIQDAYRELLGELKQSLDIKAKEPGDELFDQHQELIAKHLKEDREQRAATAAEVGRDENADLSRNPGALA